MAAGAEPNENPVAAGVAAGAAPNPVAAGVAAGAAPNENPDDAGLEAPNEKPPVAGAGAAAPGAVVVGAAAGDPKENAPVGLDAPPNPPNPDIFFS